MTPNEKELRARLFQILNEELSAACVGNGVTDCTWTVMGKSKSVDLLMLGIESAVAKRTEEMIEALEELKKTNARNGNPEYGVGQSIDLLKTLFLNEL